ncbi:MAG: luciferase family protein [Dehalococcoidia bacterium]
MTDFSDAIRGVFLATEGVLEGSSIFSNDDAEPAWFVDGKQIGNFRHGAVEVRVTKKVVSVNRPRLKVDPRVEVRSGDWVSVHINEPGDLELLAELVVLAAAAHRAADGVASRPPPTGPDLARRRRFH